MYMYIYIYIYIYIFIYLFYILYIYNKYIQYIYIYTYILVFITFIHSDHDFACFALIWYIEILNKKQVELLHTKITDNISQSFQEKSIQQNI